MDGGWLTKPISAEDLVKVVRKFFREPDERLPAREWSVRLQLYGDPGIEAPASDGGAGLPVFMSAEPALPNPAIGTETRVVRPQSMCASAAPVS